MRPSKSLANAFQHILVSNPRPAVRLLTLNRPKALNALSTPLFNELNQALLNADQDKDVSAVVLTGSEKAFAAGADIKEMQSKSFSEVYSTDFLASWTSIRQVRKPIIAAVSGYALGGGAELALMCDIILASPTAKFGLPEITLGVIPGGGGTQRLAGIVGKSRAMELVLTGRQFDAEEAERWGVASRIVRTEKKEGDEHLPVVQEALDMASKIAGFGQLSVQAGKEAVNAALDLPLSEGLRLERRLFHSLFATNDQKEGMSAFAEKRKANFTHS
ncbi:putative enoyl-CoA hydratase precursor, mitochondrial [Serendipita vermifera]|nr:putative enoyl-CoA hydratase precursor, mitochondrial [Serendipita vermifera]